MLGVGVIAGAGAGTSSAGLGAKTTSRNKPDIRDIRVIEPVVRVDLTNLLVILKERLYAWCRNAT